MCPCSKLFKTARGGVGVQVSFSCMFIDVTGDRSEIGGLYRKM